MQKFFGALTDLATHPVGRWAAAGASLRYFGIFACDYFLPMYFLRNFPAFRAEFAVFYSLIVLFGGFTSALVGGLICDKFGKGKPMTKAWVAIIGNLLAWPMFTAAVLCTGNFWFSLTMVVSKYLFGEPWKSPAITMIQNTTKPNKFGNIVSAYQFAYIMSGCLSTVLFGAVLNYFKCAGSAVAIGRILAGFCTVAYLGSSAAFYMAGRNYTAITTKTKFKFWGRGEPLGPNDPVWAY